MQPRVNKCHAAASFWVVFYSTMDSSEGEGEDADANKYTQTVVTVLEMRDDAATGDIDDDGR